MSPRKRPSRSIVGLFLGALSLTSYGLLEVNSPSPKNEPNATAHSSPLTLPDPYIVEFRGQELAWHCRHPGQDGDFQILDDQLNGGSLRVPAEYAVTLRFQSADYVYTWSLPALGAEQIAVPGMTFEVALPPLPTGRYDFLGTPFCGRDHSRLSGQLVAVPRNVSLSGTGDASSNPSIPTGFRPAQK